ncbi:glycosyltransferase [Elusimicrobiota bacterium]
MEIKKVQLNIIIAGTVFWNEMWRREHYISRLLSDQCKVLHIEPPVSIASLKKWLSNIWSMKSGNYGVRSIKENLYVLPHIALLPFGRFRIIRAINTWFINIIMRRVIKKYELDDPVLWIRDFWEADKFTGKMNEQIIIYELYDDYTTYSNYTRKQLDNIKNLEYELIKTADIVFASSHNLYEKARVHNPEVHLSPNAVNMSNYQQVTDQPEYTPADLESIRKPIIGYMGGNIYDRDNKIDFELIYHIALNRPEWSFVFLGPYNDLSSRKDLEKVAELDNTHFLGSKSLEELPGYINRFDVCILPWKLTEFTRSANPIKLFEYFACGKPVVSTAIDDLVEFHRQYPYLLKIADDKEDFILKTEESLNEDDSSLKARRTEIAKQNSWDIRVNDMLEIISGSG